MTEDVPDLGDRPTAEAPGRIMTEREGDEEPDAGAAGAEATGILMKRSG